MKKFPLIAALAILPALLAACSSTATPSGNTSNQGTQYNTDTSALMNDNGSGAMIDTSTGTQMPTGNVIDGQD